MITLYSTETCPKCKILREKMESKGIEYEDIHDVDIMMSKGISTVPVMEVDGAMMDFKIANKWINGRV